MLVNRSRHVNDNGGAHVHGAVDDEVNVNSSNRSKPLWRSTRDIAGSRATLDAFETHP